MKVEKTHAELQGFLRSLAHDGGAEVDQAHQVAAFLGIELAEPDPEPPVGQRRRSPGGVEAIKTADGSIPRWRRYAGAGVGTWFTDAEVVDWEVIADTPEVPEDVLNAVAQWIAADMCPCDDECDSGCIGTGDRLARILADAGLLVGTMCELRHLPSHSVRICLATISDEFIADLARGAGSPSGPVADAAHRERERRRLELARLGES